jgi:transcription antitermination factor NusG
MTADLPWLIFLSFAGGEWQAYRSLLRLGFEAYYPYTLDDARRGRWAQPVGRPQFPGYLFGRAPLSGIEDLLIQLVGARGVLRNNGSIIALSQEQFGEIRTRCDKMYEEGKPKPDAIAILRVGDLIEIPQGPFLGAPAIIRTIDSSGRIEAQLGPFTVTCHKSDLASVSAHTQSVREIATQDRTARRG